MEIQIQNIQKARDTVLSSSFYPMDEKFDIIRHKFTNYDQLASKLEVEFKNNRMERTRHYKVLVYLKQVKDGTLKKLNKYK